MWWCISSEGIYAWWCYCIDTWWCYWVNTGPGNGLVPSDTKPLPEPMLTPMVSISHNELILQCIKKLKHRMLSMLRGFLRMGSANKRQRYIVTSSLIGWAHTRNDPRRLSIHDGVIEDMLGWMMMASLIGWAPTQNDSQSVSIHDDVIEDMLGWIMMSDDISHWLSPYPEWSSECINTWWCYWRYAWLDNDVRWHLSLAESPPRMVLRGYRYMMVLLKICFAGWWWHAAILPLIFNPGLMNH